MPDSTYCRLDSTEISSAPARYFCVINDFCCWENTLWSTEETFAVCSEDCIGLWKKTHWKDPIIDRVYSSSAFGNHQSALRVRARRGRDCEFRRCLVRSAEEGESIALAAGSTLSRLHDASVQLTRTASRGAYFLFPDGNHKQSSDWLPSAVGAFAALSG